MIGTDVLKSLMRASPNGITAQKDIIRKMPNKGLSEVIRESLVGFHDIFNAIILSGYNFLCATQNSSSFTVT
jgi:hypothetical protein